MPSSEHYSKEIERNTDKQSSADHSETDKEAREKLFDDAWGLRREEQSKPTLADETSKEEKQNKPSDLNQPLNKPKSEDTNQNTEKDSSEKSLYKSAEETRPLSTEVVAKEAKVLQDLADKLLAGDNPKEAFEAWHAELLKLAKHGFGSVGSVFQKMKDNNKESWNPFKDDVYLNKLENGSIQIEITPGVIEGAFLVNYRNIGGIINADGSVFSSADLSRLGGNNVSEFKPHSYLDVPPLRY
jgi:hypothetical protein